MANPKQRLKRSEEGFPDKADILLKKKILLNILSEEDVACIKLYVYEMVATRGISGTQRYRLISSLASSRKWLKMPFRKMTTPDLFMGIDAILNDGGLDQNSIGDYVRNLKDLSLWMIDNEMAAPGLKRTKVSRIIPPAYTPDAKEVDSLTDSIPYQEHQNAEGKRRETDFLVTVAAIFQSSTRYDLAKILAEYCIGDPRHQKTCLTILKECAYSQKDFSQSLEFIDSLLEKDPQNPDFVIYKAELVDLAHGEARCGTVHTPCLIEAFFFTHIGGVRVKNEDSLLISQTIFSDVSMEGPEIIRTDYSHNIYCVADGIGGEQKGEVASHMVLSGLYEYQDTITDGSTLLDTLYLAKEQLDAYAMDNPEAFNLGCTLSGLCIRGKTGLAFNVGDCRVYRITDGKFELITRDHSVVQTLFEEGVISEDEMRHHPKRNIITSSISGDGRPDSIKVFTTEIDLRTDDKFFICSDGIWGCFSHAELEMIYERFQGFEYCEKIQTAAIARRASDNISAILVHILLAEG